MSEQLVHEFLQSQPPSLDGLSHLGSNIQKLVDFENEKHTSFQRSKEQQEVSNTELNDMLMYYRAMIDDVKQANYVSQSELENQQQLSAHNRRHLVHQLDPDITNQKLNEQANLSHSLHTKIDKQIETLQQKESELETTQQEILDLKKFFNLKLQINREETQPDMLPKKFDLKMNDKIIAPNVKPEQLSTSKMPLSSLCRRNNSKVAKYQSDFVKGLASQM